MDDIISFFNCNVRPNLKKWIKYFLIGIAVLTVISIIEAIIRVNWYKDVTDSTLTYKQTEYEALDEWSMFSDDFAEDSVTLTSANGKKSQTVSAKVYSGQNEQFIEAKVRGQNVLFVKKGTDMPKFTQREKIVRVEAQYKGEYIAFSNEQKDKFLNYLDKHYDKTIFHSGVVNDSGSYSHISDLRIIYNVNGVQLCNYFGKIILLGENYALVPNDNQLENASFWGSAVVLLPFDPLSNLEGKK